MTDRLLYCHSEPFGSAQGKLREESFSAWGFGVLKLNHCRINNCYRVPNEPRAMTCRAAIANSAVMPIKMTPNAAAMGICPFCQ
jgi:hypothetical protein